ncbi:sugar porter family MFS transporter [Actinomadura verrucosospora]|uniref:Bicyclomycin resistance protein TcaB n=1 Tax=Actinomadura verrucosospora TaxID=46165 RepID=A0A7D3ZYI3_ACTVE|nr:sugar porter family MFS transporter [Actinomadura verrucosospora]QKG21404.1 bicyclomycin resistance protein TcaB [Actinomadura verrucosospora]
MQGFSSATVYEGPLAEVPPDGLRKIWLWAVLIAVGGFLFGFDTGVISGALLYIKTDFGLNSFEQSSVVSVLVLGAMVGAMGSGRIADRIGRRRILGLEGLVFLVGTVIAVLSTGYAMLVLGRLVLGLAVGGASATVPVYLSEISPKEIRGRTLTLNQLLITIGILVAYLTNLAFSGAGDWRAMIGIGAVPAAVIVAASLWVLPESAAWLASRGDRAEARRLVASVTNEATADRLLDRYDRDRAREGDDGGAAGWRTLLAADVRPALVVGLALAAVQQFGGINTIIYYAPTIIEETGLTASNSIVYSIAIGIINLVMTLIAIRVIDRSGRRPLLLFSLGAMTVMMALLGLSFVADWSSGLSLVCMVLYIAGYAVGTGPVFWTLIGEIFPPRARAAGSSASTAVNWLANFVVSLIFLPIANVIGQGETFWIFAVIAAAGWVFVSRFVPETKERDFTQVDADLRSRFGRPAPASADPD